MTRIFLVLSAFFVAAQVSASEPIDYVGAISINPSHDAKVLADWYGKFGIQTQEMNICPQKPNPCMGYFKLTGSWLFAIHPKRNNAAKRSSRSVDIVFHVGDYDSYLANAAKNNILPKCTEADSSGRFAHFIDLDGNQVTVWGAPNGQTTDPCAD